MTRDDVEFPSDGITLRGWLYHPIQSQRPNPAIVMAHGYSAVKEQYLDRYAEVFATAGFAVLVYDNPNFGDSDGLPRQEVDPVRQRRAYRDAVSFLQTLVEIDKDRIGLWGSSYSGGHVIEVGAIDRRVKCVVSQVPTISGYQSSLRRTRADQVSSALRLFERDRAARFRGEPAGVMQVVEEDPGKPAAMAGHEARDFFLGSRSFAPNWQNTVTIRSAEMARENEPGIYIARISPTPLLMIVADADHTTATDLCLSAYQEALEPKKLVMIPGGHFTPYVEHFEVTSAAARDWFATYLLPAACRAHQE